MSYFPILSAPGCRGWTTMFNFAPNNWEEGPRVSRFLNVTWSNGETWQTRALAELQYGETKTVHIAGLHGLVPEGCLPLLSLTDKELPASTSTLATNGMPHTHSPNWRATLGLSAESGASTCYQGEIDPFPVPGSLLTFGHFLQPGVDTENYLLFLNIEKSPVSRTASLEVRDAANPASLKASFEVRNNGISIVRLDLAGANEEELPLILCKGMSGIPLYFSRSGDGNHLSLEHSHPPASSVIHGRRWEAQKLLKQIWFSKAGQS